MTEGLIAVAIFLAGQLIAGLIWGSAISVKVDTLWDFLMRRGKVEAVEKGFGTINSPFMTNIETKEWLDKVPVVNDIKKYFYKGRAYKRDSELAYEIERKFGERLVDEICIPKHIYRGACMALMIDAIRKERRLKDVPHFPERRKA